MRTAKEIITKCDLNEYCIALYVMNCSQRGQKQFLRDCIGRYDADIIIKTPIHEIVSIYKTLLKAA